MSNYVYLSVAHDRISPIAARKNQERTQEAPKYSREQLEKLMKDFLYRREMIVNQLQSTLPGYRHLIQDRLDEINAQIATLEAQIEQAKEIPA